MRKTMVKSAGAMLWASLVAGGITGCASETNERAAMTGADSDTHGCKASAGYRWCAKTRQCERPWELAEKKGFEKTTEAFDAFCKRPKAP